MFLGQNHTLSKDVITEFNELLVYFCYCLTSAVDAVLLVELAY